MRNKVHFILLLVCFFSVLSACNQKDEKTDTEQSLDTENDQEEIIKVMDDVHLANLPEVFKQIHEKDKLDIAMYFEDRYPYFFVNEQGELVGSDVDMAYDIARQLGVQDVEFNRTAKTYDEIIDLVVENEVDLAISKISVTSNRAQRVLFSEPYIKLKQAVLINRMNLSQIKTTQAVDMDTVQFLTTNDVDIGVVDGTSYVEFAKEVFQSANLILFETKESMLDAVQKGEILAAFYDEFEFKRFIKDHPDASLDLQLIVMDGRNDFLAIAIPAEHILMQSWLRHYLDYREELDVDQILQKYSMESEKADE